MHIRHRAATLATALLLTAALTGCSVLGGDSSSGDGGGGGGAGPGKAANAVGKGEPKVADPAKPLVKITTGSAKGPVELAVVSLSARGRLAHLTLSLTLRGSTEGINGGSENLYGVNGGNFPAVSLLDAVNLKRYVVVKDSADREVGSGNPTFTPNQPSTLSYTFAAPPENVQAVDVQFGYFPIFRNVPIER
ncbi:hypothetical protein [Actinomadura hibisca]|uniref:hypothetical protein n=1 Tax=Actinomadura hibisca TaxID=68565 RepID=UPI0008374CEA|nr:hypothetical protein [Actinomadura hibisca]